MRISDWSSDVCSSDLRGEHVERNRHRALDAFDMAIARVGRTRRDTQGGAQRGLLVRAQELIDELAEIDQTRRAWINEVVEVLVEPGQRHIALEIGRASCRERVCKYV